MEQARPLRLRFTLVALRQIDQALDYLEERSPQGAEKLRQRISETVSLIENFPHIAQTTGRPGLRRVVLSPFPYVLFYRVTKDEIIVSRFRQAARRP